MKQQKEIFLSEAISSAVAEGKHIVRACREFLGYTVEELALACGLTADEITRIESGYRYGKGYRERIARALALPAHALEAAPEVRDAA